MMKILLAALTAAPPASLACDPAASAGAAMTDPSVTTASSTMAAPSAMAAPSTMAAPRAMAHPPRPRHRR